MAKCREMGLSPEESLGRCGTVFHYSPTLTNPTCGKSVDECFIPLRRRGGDWWGIRMADSCYGDGCSGVAGEVEGRC